MEFFVFFGFGPDLPYSLVLDDLASRFSLTSQLSYMRHRMPLLHENFKPWDCIQEERLEVRYLDAVTL